MRWTRVLVLGSWVSLALLAVAVALRVGWQWTWLMSLPSRTVTAVLAVAACSSAAVDMGFLRPVNGDGGDPAWSLKRPAVPAVLSVVLDSAAEKSLRDHLAGPGGPMTALPRGATEAGTVPTTRVC